LAGYILDNLEALPAKGDTFEIEGYSFTILTMTDTRIEWILVHPLAKE
jgi:CBS domain containing-hemolysin-like protein